MSKPRNGNGNEQMPWTCVIFLVVLCKIIAGEIMRHISEEFTGLRNNDFKFNVTLHIQLRAVVSRISRLRIQYLRKFGRLVSRITLTTNLCRPCRCHSGCLKTCYSCSVSLTNITRSQFLEKTAFPFIARDNQNWLHMWCRL